MQHPRLQALEMDTDYHVFWDLGFQSLRPVLFQGQHGGQLQ